MLMKYANMPHVISDGEINREAALNSVQMKGPTVCCFDNCEQHLCQQTATVQKI